MKKRSVVRLWWGERNRQDHRALNRTLMEQTLHCVLNDRYKVPFVTYVCGKENYDFLKSEGVDDLVLVTPEPRLITNSEIDAQHRLHLCDVALQDFEEIICLNWDCRLVKPFIESVWDDLHKKEAIQAGLIKSKARVSRPMVNTRGDEGNIFSIDGFMYLRDKTLPKKILALLDDPDVPNKWTPESLISIYLDRLHDGWIGVDKYFELYEPECFLAGKLALWKHHTKKDIRFAYQRYYKTCKYTTRD